MIVRNNKFAVLSHVLPPSPSGQAVILYRLLEKLSPEKYCLISHKNYRDPHHNIHGSRRFPAKYYYLKPAFQLRRPSRFKLSWLHFFLNTPLVIFSRAIQLKKILRQEHCKLLIACTGNLYDLPAAYLASKWFKVPFIAYIFDDYAYQWTGISRIISKWLEPRILKKAQGVIVTNEFAEKEYSRRYGIKSMIISNFCPIPNLEELDKANAKFDQKHVNIVYTGAVYHANYDAFHNIITAIKDLGRADIKLHLYTDQPQSQLRKEGIYGDMLVFHPHTNQPEIPIILRQADILFLPLAFNSPIPEVIKTSLPGKMSEYLSTGQAILVHAPEYSFVNHYFRTNRCGMVVGKNDLLILKEALRELISDRGLRKELGQNARTCAEKDFSMEVIRTRFYEYLNSTL